MPALRTLSILTIAAFCMAFAGCGDKASTAPAAPDGAQPSPGFASPSQPGAAQPRPSGKPIALKAGVTVPKTGAIATYGDEAEKGMMLAAEHARAAGAVIPQLVEIDNGGTQQQTETSAKQFIDVEKVSVILGPVTTNNAIAAGRHAEAAGVPLVTPSATAVDVTAGKKYVFRVCFTDDFQGGTVADFAFDTLGARSAGLLVNQSEAYSQGVAKAIRQRFESRGGRIVTQLSFTADTDDFGGQITQLRMNRPDVVFLPAYYESAAKCISQARAAGLRATFVGTDGWDSPALYTLSAGTVKGNFFATHFSPLEDRPAVRNFVTAYRARYNADPGAIAALSYDAAMLAFDAARRAGSADRQAIADALAATKDFEGVTGRFSLDANHNPVKTILILETTDKGAVLKQVISPR